MSNLGKSRGELNGWKEIGAYLGVSVRTVQEYEKQRGLPIRREADQSKSRVFAYSGDLDEWKERKRRSVGSGEAVAEPESGDAGSSVSTYSAWLRWQAIAAVCLVLAGISCVMLWQNRHKLLADFRVLGRNLIAVDSGGRELWRYTFATPLSDEAYGSQYLKARKAWIGDLGGNNGSVLIFIADPLNIGDFGSTVMCFGADGRVRWQFTPGRAVDSGGIRFVPPYSSSHLQVILGKNPSETRVMISSNHYLAHPDQVAFLTTQGHVAAEYWHPGHLLHSALVDLDGNGHKELLLGGVNNGNHQATLVVLDPARMSGVVTPKQMRDHRFEILNMQPACEVAVAFFPRSCISRGQPYNRVKSIGVTRDRVVVQVAEGTAESAAGFVYELDYGLHVLNVSPMGIAVWEQHKQLEQRGILDHQMSDAEVQQLGSAVVLIKPLTGAFTASHPQTR